MGVRVECDWCRQTIPPGDPYVTVEIDGKMKRQRGEKPHAVSQPARVYCGEGHWIDEDPAASGYDIKRWGHRPSCAEVVLSALDGNPKGRADMGLEWRLVAQPTPRADRLIEAPVDALDLSSRALAALHRAGVKTVRELARMTEAQWLAVPGIGRGGAEEIHKALHHHSGADAKTIATAAEKVAS